MKPTIVILHMYQIYSLPVSRSARKLGKRFEFLQKSYLLNVFNLFDVVTLQPQGFQSYVFFQALYGMEAFMMQIQDCVESWSHIQIVLSAMFLKRGPQKSINLLGFPCAVVHNGVKKNFKVFFYLYHYEKKFTKLV